MRRNQRHIVALLLSILSFNCYLQAQEEFVPPPARKLTTFNFRMFTGGVILIKGSLNNIQDSLNFILDTGSGGISLDSVTALSLKVPITPSDKTIRGIAGVRTVSFAYNNTLKLPGLSVDSLNFHINDYDILTSVYGERIDGIIGYSFFNRYIVKIDYDSMKIHVFSKGSMKYPRGGHLLKPLLVNLLIQSATIGEDVSRFSRFYFDTGAGLCLLLSQDFVQDSAVISPQRKRVITQVEGMGGKKMMELTVVKNFKLGPYKFKKVPAYVFDDEFNVTSYPYLGGLIGNDILRRFNTIINYEKRDVYLIPNTHFRDPFDYSYTGLNFYYINNKVIVTEVMKGSPAEQAGIKEGDEIIGINNILTKNMLALKNALQVPGEKAKILVQREEGPVLITMRVKSIL
ncbi:MAG: aspartyl protease family protein [Flavihumibacter sp.]|nr:aspartyl protease family protein [Flavihumibacter sp.]